MAWWAWIAVGILGSLAALARFGVELALSRRESASLGGLPVGTITVNLSGAFLLGLIVGLALNGEALVLVGSATIGSYTTFSSWMLQTQRLREEGQTLQAVINVAISVVIGLAAVALGRLLGEHL